MEKIAFVLEPYLRENLPISGNLDIKEMLPFILPAQDVYIRDVLGDELYIKLCDAIENDDVSSDGTDVYSKLLVLIQPALAYYVLVDSMPFLSDKIKNIGIISTTDEKQARTDSAKEKLMSHKMLQKAQYYLDRVIKFLYNNHKEIPEYNVNNHDINPRKQSPYKSQCTVFIDPTSVHEQNVREYRYITPRIIRHP